jgi:hypothetical protein
MDIGLPALSLVAGAVIIHVPLLLDLADDRKQQYPQAMSPENAKSWVITAVADQLDFLDCC